MITIKYSEADFGGEELSWKNLDTKSTLDETIETQFEDAMAKGVLVSFFFYQFSEQKSYMYHKDKNHNLVISPILPPI